MGNSYETVLNTIQKMASESLPTGDEMERPRKLKHVGFGSNGHSSN